MQSFIMQASILFDMTNQIAIMPLGTHHHHPPQKKTYFSDVWMNPVSKNYGWIKIRVISKFISIKIDIHIYVSVYNMKQKGILLLIQIIRNSYQQLQEKKSKCFKSGLYIYLCEKYCLCIITMISEGVIYSLHLIWETGMNLMVCGSVCRYNPCEPQVFFASSNLLLKYHHNFPPRLTSLLPKP